MAYIPLSPKVIEKWRKEDIELHKRVITSYLIQYGYKVTTRHKFFALYDMLITPSNILCYFHKPVRIFVKAMVLNKLDQIADIYPDSKPKKRTRKSHKKK